MVARLCMGLVLVLVGVALGFGLATGFPGSTAGSGLLGGGGLASPGLGAAGQDELGLHRFTVVLPGDVTDQHMVGLVLESPTGAPRHLGHAGGFAPGLSLEVAVLLDGSLGASALVHHAWILGPDQRMHIRWEDRGEMGPAFHAVARSSHGTGETLMRLCGPDGEVRGGPGPAPVGSDDVDLVLRAWLP